MKALRWVPDLNFSQSDSPRKDASFSCDCHPQQDCYTCQMCCFCSKLFPSCFCNSIRHSFFVKLLLKSASSISTSDDLGERWRGRGRVRGEILVCGLEKPRINCVGLGFQSVLIPVSKPLFETRSSNSCSLHPYQNYDNVNVDNVFGGHIFPYIDPASIFPNQPVRPPLIPPPFTSFCPSFSVYSTLHIFTSTPVRSQLSFSLCLSCKTSA